MTTFTPKVRIECGFDLNPDYCAMARRRVLPEAQPRLALGGEAVRP